MQLVNRANILSFSLLVLFFVVFSPVWLSLVSSWASSEDYSHGFLIVPLALYLVWQKRSEYRRLEAVANWYAFPLIVFSLLLYLLAHYAEIRTLASLSMILFIGASIFFLAGWRFFKTSIFPLTLLLFMVPVPAQIYATLTIPLQLFVTKTTAIIASGVGIPLVREGNIIHLPEHTLEVVQACSGLRSIMSLLTLGAVIAYFGLRGNVLKWILFLTAIPIAVCVNIVRVMAMVLAFYYFDIDLTQGAIHTYVGLGVFVLAILIFLLVRKGLSLCVR